MSMHKNGYIRPFFRPCRGELWIEFDMGNGIQSFRSHRSSKLTDWTLLSVGSVYNSTSSGGRDALISMVHSRSFWDSGWDKNPTSYSTANDTLSGGSASPAMGAVYSFLALRYVRFSNLVDKQALTVQLMHSLPNLSITLPSDNLAPQGPPGHSTSQATSNVPVIIWTIFGFLGLILLFVVVLFFLRQRSRQKLSRIVLSKSCMQGSRGHLILHHSRMNPNLT